MEGLAGTNADGPFAIDRPPPRMPFLGLAPQGGLPFGPASLAPAAADAGVGDVMNERKRSGDEMLDADGERRVRPRVEVPPASPLNGADRTEGAEEEEDDLDTRLRALVEVASQRKGDSPLPKSPAGYFRGPHSGPLYEAAAQPAAGLLKHPRPEAPSHEALDEGAMGASSLAPGFPQSGWDGRNHADVDDRHTPSPPVEGLGASEAVGLGYSQAPLEAEAARIDAAPFASGADDGGAQEYEGRPEVEYDEEEAGEGGGEGAGAQMEEEEEDHGFGAAHGFGAHPQAMHAAYAGYEQQAHYGMHPQYMASVEAQQLAEHAGFGGGHLEGADEDGDRARGLELAEVGFARSSVADLQTLPPDDLITRVLDLEERIAAVVREKQLEAAARQEAEDSAARYAEESRQLRQVVRERNGYKKGVLQEMAVQEGTAPPVPRFTIMRESSPGGGLRLESGNKSGVKPRSLSPIKEKWRAEWRRAAAQSRATAAAATTTSSATASAQHAPVAPPSVSMLGGEEVPSDPFMALANARYLATVKGFRSRKAGPAQATPASRLLAILGAEPDAPDDDDDDDDGGDEGSDEEYVAPLDPPPRSMFTTGPAPPRTSRAESTVGLEDLSEFLRTCCKPKQTGHMTLHRVLWYTYLAWRERIKSPRSSVSSGGVGLSQCMQKLGHRERLFTREIQAKKAGCKGYEGGGKYWMGLVVLDKGLLKTGRQWLAKAKRTGSSNRVTFSRDSATIKVQANEAREEAGGEAVGEEDDEDGEYAGEA